MTRTSAILIVDFYLNLTGAQSLDQPSNLMFQGSSLEQFLMVCYLDIDLLRGFFHHLPEDKCPALWQFDCQFYNCLNVVILNLSYIFMENC